MNARGHAVVEVSETAKMLHDVGERVWVRLLDSALQKERSRQCGARTRWLIARARRVRRRSGAPRPPPARRRRRLRSARPRLRLVTR